jgi:uncharacterized protein (DUF2126 family)
MPPHARMSSPNNLLLRASSPASGRLLRAASGSWGTELHDRFMLPHFVHEDFREVIADLQSNVAR